MPYFLEVISFDTLRHDDLHFGAITEFGHTPAPNVLKFDAVGRMSGCVGIVGGYELEDQQRAYVITAWTSYEAYHYTCDMHPILSMVYPAFKVDPDQISNIHVYHLTVNMHPHRTLSAPVTEISVVSQRTDRMFTSERAWERSVGMCVTQLKAGLYAVDGAYPPLLWGEIKQMPGKYLMLVGWDGVEAHTKAVRQPSLRRHVVDILKAAHSRAVHTRLQSLVSIDAADSARSNVLARRDSEVMIEPKLHTSM